MTIVIRSLASALIWSLGAGVGAYALGASNGASVMMSWLLAVGSATLAVIFKPQMKITFNVQVSGAETSRPNHFILVRWFRARRYSMNELLGLGVNDFKVAVPLVYLDFSDGQHVGPILCTRQSPEFLRQVIVALKVSDRLHDQRLRENIDLLERYLEQSGS